MGDMGDDFRALREANKEKRRTNRERSTALLRQRGIEFKTRNDGAHLIVADNRADFWPGTGRWIMRDGSRKGFGVWRLILTLEGKA